MKKAQILSEKPFKDLFRILRVQSLAHAHARSGNTYLIETNKGRFKLTHFDEEARAAWYEQVVPQLYPAVPTLLRRQGAYLLSTWLDGETLEPPVTVTQARGMGRALGRIASVNLVVNKNPEKLFFTAYATSKPHLTPEVAQEVMHYYNLYRPAQAIARLEAADAQPRNFVECNKKIWYVDEGGIAYKMKGLSMAKPYLEGWLDTPEKEQALKEGYEEFESLDWFTQDYKRFVMLYQAVRSLHHNAHDERKLQKKLSQLHTMLRKFRSS